MINNNELISKNFEIFFFTTKWKRYLALFCNIKSRESRIPEWWAISIGSEIYKYLIWGLILTALNFLWFYGIVVVKPRYLHPKSWYRRNNFKLSLDNGINFITNVHIKYFNKYNSLRYWKHRLIHLFSEKNQNCEI